MAFKKQLFSLPAELVEKSPGFGLDIGKLFCVHIIIHITSVLCHIPDSYRPRDVCSASSAGQTIAKIAYRPKTAASDEEVGSSQEDQIFF